MASVRIALAIAVCCARAAGVQEPGVCVPESRPAADAAAAGTAARGDFVLVMAGAKLLLNKEPLACAVRESKNAAARHPRHAQGGGENCLED
jgi:hypothetical protein